MDRNITFTMIKPDAVSKNYTGDILQMICSAGFVIKAMKMLLLTELQARKFYEVHEGKDFFEPLIKFMISGPLIAIILEKENAVTDYRLLIGKTNPAEAVEGTIRKKYATSVRENAVHGSDSDETAQIECDFFFSELDRV